MTPTTLSQMKAELPENPVLKVGQFKVAESNVFLMTRFRTASYHQAMSDAVADGVRPFGLELLRADDPQLGVRRSGTK